MTTLTPEQRGDLAEQLLPVAARLSCIVHGDGGNRDAHQAIARLTPEQRDALLIVLAGLVDPDAKLSDLLGYLAWDENGRPQRPVRVGGTIRDLADDWWETHWTPRQHAGMTDREAAIIEDTALLAANGCTREDIAERVGVGSWNTVTKVHSRHKVPIPALPRLERHEKASAA